MIIRLILALCSQSLARANEDPSGNCGFLCIGCLDSESSVCSGCVDNASQASPDSPCVCDEGFIYSGSACLPRCSELCGSCDSESVCLSCVPNAILSGSTCECSEGFYASGSECLECGQNCKHCDPSDPIMCSSCIENAHKMLDLPYMACECDDNYIETSQGCLRVLSNCEMLCEGCDDDDPSICINCVENAVKTAENRCECQEGFVPSGTVCLPLDCADLCVGCDPQDPYLCAKCTQNASKVLDLEYMACECDDGYFETDGQCIAIRCGDLCDECVDEECVRCKENASSSGSGCECNDGFEKDNGQCITCSKTIEAHFDQEFVKIIVFFSEEIEDRKTDCSLLLRNLSEIGNNPTCSWPSAKKLEVHLGSEFYAKLSTLHLNPDLFLKYTCYIEDARVPITKRMNNPPAVATIRGPRFYSKGCPDTDLVISGEYSSGMAQHPLVYTWGASTKDLNAYVKSQTSSVLIIPSSILYEGAHIISLEVRNIFGKTSWTSHTIQVFSDPILSVEIDPSNVFEGILTSDFTFRASIIDNCGLNDAVSYKWSNGAEGSTLVLHKEELSPDEMYTLTVEAFIGNVTGSETLTLTTKKPDLVPIISRVDGVISDEIDLELDGSSSYDPYDENTELFYYWFCYSEDNKDFKYDGKSPRITIPKKDLTQGNEITVILTVSDGVRLSNKIVYFTIESIPEEELPVRSSEFEWNSHEDLLIELDGSAISSDEIKWYQVSGETIEPSTPTNLPYIKFPSGTMKSGQYYEWEAQFLNTDQNIVKHRYYWNMNMPAECISELKIQKEKDMYIIYIEHCEDRDNYRGELTYKFGKSYKGQIAPISQRSSKNYVMSKLPAGSYDLIGEVCDSQGACSTYTLEGFSNDSKDLLYGDKIKEAFEEDILNLEDIPSSVFYYASEYDLTESLWDLLFSHLSSYMATNTSNASSCMVAIDSLIDQEVVDTRRLVSVFEIIRDSEFSLSYADISMLLESIDTVFLYDLNALHATQITLYSILEKYMENSPPFDAPVVFNSSSISIKRERLLGESILGKIMTFNDISVRIPEDTKLESTDILDLTIINFAGVVIDVSIHKTGTYTDFKLNLAETNNTTPQNIPLQINSPFTEINDPACFYLNKNEWKSDKCKIIGEEEGKFILELYESGAVTVANKKKIAEQSHLAPMIALGVLISTMFVYIMVRVFVKCEKNSEPKPNPTIYNTVSISQDVQFNKKAIETAPEKDMPQPQAQAEPEPKPLMYIRNHLFFGQFSAYHISEVQRALVLWTVIFVNFAVSGVVTGYFGDSFDVANVLAYAAITALVSFTCAVVLDTHKLNKFVRIALCTITLIASVAGAIGVIIFAPTDAWLLVVAVSLTIDLLFIQSVYAAVKMIIFK